MAMAYALVIVEPTLWAQAPEEAKREGQVAADRQFEKLATDARKTLVTRNPDPEVVPYREVEEMFPEWTPAQVRFAVVLRFTADIT